MLSKYTCKNALFTLLMLGMALAAAVAAAQDAPAEDGPMQMLPPEVQELVSAEMGEDINRVSVMVRIRGADGRYMTVTMKDGKVQTVAVRMQYEDVPEAVRATVKKENEEAAPRFVQKTIEPESGKAQYKLLWRGGDNMVVSDDGTLVKMTRRGLKPADLPETARKSLRTLVGEARIIRLQMEVADGEKTYRARAEGIRGYCIVGADGTIIKDPRGIRGRLPENELP